MNQRGGGQYDEYRKAGYQPDYKPRAVVELCRNKPADERAECRCGYHNVIERAREQLFCAYHYERYDTQQNYLRRHCAQRADEH